MTDVEQLKVLIREREYPYFSDDELQFWINSEGSVQAAAYRCLILKSENTTLTVSGLSAADSSSYFKRLASRFKPSNSGVLK